MFPELQIREGWITVLCLLLMVLCVAWAIQAAEWAQGLSVLQGAVTLGALVGIVLAKSRFPARMAHILSFVGGWTWSTYLTARVLALATDLPWQVAIVELDARFQDLIFRAFAQGTGADNYVFVLILSFSLWFVAYFGAWAVFRWQRVWWAVILSGVALLLNINYAMADLTRYLILFLLAALLLVVRASVALYEQEWRRAQVGYSSELVSSFLQAGLIVSIAVILLAWVAPSALASRPLQPFWDKVAEPWRRFQDRSARVFQDLNYQNPAPLAYLGEKRMRFGGPVHLSDTPIADVKASQGRYWRVTVFHEYTGDGWLSTDPETLLIDAYEQGLAFPEFDLRQEITQTVQLYQSLTTADALIAAGQPLTASLPLRAAVTFVTHQEDVVRAPGAPIFPSAPGDPSLLYSREALQVGDRYRVLSSLTRADEESLRSAGTDYPEWVTPRYLQLPDSLPRRIRQLAEELAQDQETAYDKARAVERYLRQIPYNLQIDGPRLGQDGVDYFLFDAQEGYCDYYASSMVVLLRAVGVPARYVRGYIEPLADEDDVYHLLESDGHAWPEVFFPGYGWIEFEPTGGQPALTRPRSQDPAAAVPPPARDRPLMDTELDARIDTEIDPGAWPAGTRSGWAAFLQRVRPGAWFLLVGGLLGFLGLALFRVWRHQQIEGLTVAERLYADLVNWVRYLLRIEPQPHQTPHEYAGVVAQNVPAGRRAVEDIVGYYVQERFGGRPPSDDYADEAWQQVWSALWRRWFHSRTWGLQRLWHRLVPRGPIDPDQA